MFDVRALFTPETATKLFSSALEFAASLSLPVTSWREGDPTRTTLKWLALVLEGLEGFVSDLAKSSWLSTVDDDFAGTLSSEVYGVTRTEATYATSASGEGVDLANSSDNYYEFDAGGLSFRSSITGKTYRSTESVVLVGGGTGTVGFVADEAGADSSVLDDDIDELITTALGVSITGSDPALATDQQSLPELKEQCNASLGALSPDGPADAYEFVCRNPALTGVTDITRAQSGADTYYAEVTVYVASPTGAPAFGSVTAAQAAVERWATPIGFMPIVTAVSTVNVNLQATVYGSDIPGDYQDTIEAKVIEMLSGLAIGQDVVRSKLDQVIHDAVPQIERVEISTPASTVAVGPGQVAVLSGITITLG